MKKILSLCVTFAMALTFVFSSNVVQAEENDQDIKVYLRNYTNRSGDYEESKEIQFDVKPQLIDNRVMVPIRAIAEELGYTVNWTPEPGSGGLVDILTTIHRNNDRDVNKFIESKHQYKDFIYLNRQVLDGKNPTSFKVKRVAYRNNFKLRLNDVPEYDSEITLDDVLYNSKQYLRARCTFKVNCKTAGEWDAHTTIYGCNDGKYTYVGGEYTLDVKPQIIDGRTLVPLRAAAELLGLHVEWVGKTKTVIITA